MSERTLSRRSALVGLGLTALFPSHRAASASGAVSIIDTHIHPPRGPRGEDYDFDPGIAARDLDRFGIARAILSPPPIPPDRRRPTLAQLVAIARRSPRLAFAAGGESLNPILQATPADQVPSGLLRRFTSIAEEIAAAGAASFGELAAEHLSSGRGRHPYESSPPDHPLLFALADVAAHHGLPIDLHMEAVPNDMALPPERRHPANPERLHANIARLEHLLEHNREARIVWLHAGWDLTGERTVSLMRGLLGRHPNLAMSIKSDRSGAIGTSPFVPDGDRVRAGWIAMLRAFPDRFMIGSDQFIGEPPERLEEVRRLVDALPPDLSGLIAAENATRIYRLR